MKKKFLPVAALVLAFALLGGCGSVGDGLNSPASPQTITSSISSLSLEFPSSWQEIDLNTGSSIEIARLAKEQFLLVREEPSVYFGDGYTLDEYAELVKALIETSAEAPESSATTDIVINGIPAKQFEQSCIVEKVKLKYLITCFEHDGTFYRFSAWSLLSLYDEAKPVFEGILETITFDS
jgi:hypothetical protein